VVGRGSRFAVSIPYGDTGQETEAAVASAMSGGGVQDKCILVIDNDATALDGMQAVLESWGCRLVTATSAAQALERLAAAGQAPDCVVMDYHLDSGTLGTAEIAILRGHFGRDLPALVVSADRSAALQAEMKAAGQAFLTKPISPARLRAMISYLVGSEGLQ
jgi:CheY-like chemotaxis protein